MLHSINQSIGHKLEARDGEVGKSDDFLFDDVGWFVRYVVVNTGGWLTGRKVLLAPEALGPPKWDEGSLPVKLRKAAIEDAPPIDEDAPVSRQLEERLRAFYGWPSWWATPTQGLLVQTPQGAAPHQAGGDVAVEIGAADPHLRSAKEVIGYHIEATDGDIGHVEDFVLDDRSWAIRYFVVDTRNILPGKKVILSPHWIADVSWADAKVKVDLTKEQIEEAPEFESGKPIGREFEKRVYDYYGRPKYW